MKVPQGKKNKSIILIEITGDLILTLERLIDTYGSPKPRTSWLIDKEITDQTACTFDIRTKTYADNRVYKGKKGLYIKKGGRKYYLEDFV